jgi:uncharacterized membrane protein
MQDVDMRVLTKAMDIYKERYGEGQMDLFKLDEIIKEIQDNG